MRNKIMNWWWPVFVAAFPWALWPDGTHTIASSYFEHYIFAGVAAAGWMLLLLTDGSATMKTSLQNLYRSLRRHPPLITALAFGVWAIVASFFSPEPSLSLTGSIEDYKGSALYVALLVAVFVFTYLYYESRDGTRVQTAVVLSALALTLASLYEVATGNALFYRVNPGRHPMVSFLGYGHLAGFLALASGLLVGAPSRWTAMFSLFLLSVGMGLTNNRTSVLATMLTAMGANLNRSLGKALGLLGLISIGVIAGWGVVQLYGGDLRPDLTKSTTLEDRFTYWNIAISGIRQRPLTGWGGGQYYRYMGNVADVEDLKNFLQDPNIDLIFHNENVFSYKDISGKMRLEKLNSWSAHNFILDTSLNFGIPAALLYLLLVFFNIRGFFHGNPAAAATIAYHAFLLMWPVAVEASAVLWIMMALGSLPKPRQ